MAQPIDSLVREDSARSSNEERRASTRHPANVRVRCMPASTTDNPPIWTAQVRDLSNHGIGLILPKAPGHGMLIEIELKRKNGTFVRTLLARVVHEEPETSKSVIVGCA